MQENPHPTNRVFGKDTKTKQKKIKTQNKSFEEFTEEPKVRLAAR